MQPKAKAKAKVKARAKQESRDESVDSQNNDAQATAAMLGGPKRTHGRSSCPMGI